MISLLSKPQVSIKNTPYKSKNIFTKPVYNNKHFLNKKQLYTTISKPNTRDISAKAIPDWINSIQTIGHGIVYFTIFYCSMNWIYYRNTRIDTEKIIEEKKSKKDKIIGKKEDKKN